MGQNACKCPPPTTKSLPQNIWEMAKGGDVEGIRDYVSSGADVNAANAQGETLLSGAARNGQQRVVDELLKSPYLHLNTYHVYKGADTYTPLWIAAANGHLNCVNALISSNLSCRIDPIGSKSNDFSTIMIAAKNGHWNIFNKFISVHESMSSEEANYIFPIAVRAVQWNAAIKSLAKCSYFRIEVLEQFLNQAIEADHWRIIQFILRKTFRTKNVNLYRVLSKFVRQQKWERVALLLGMMPGDVSFDENFAIAALSYDQTEVFKLFKDNTFSVAVRNGNLVVIAAGGTSDSIAKFLYNVESYDQNVVEAVLCLSAMNGHIEILQQIFSEQSRYRFTYNILSTAQKLANQGGHMNADRLLSKILDKEAELYATYYVATR